MAEFNKRCRILRFPGLIQKQQFPCVGGGGTQIWKWYICATNRVLKGAASYWKWVAFRTGPHVKKRGFEAKNNKETAQVEKVESLGAAKAKNGGLSGGIYPYCPNMGVPLPPPPPPPPSPPERFKHAPLKVRFHVFKTHGMFANGIGFVLLRREIGPYAT